MQILVFCMIEEQIPDMKLLSQFTSILYRRMMLLIWVKNIPL